MIVCNGCGEDFDVDDIDENNFCIGCMGLEGLV